MSSGVSGSGVSGVEGSGDFVADSGEGGAGSRVVVTGSGVVEGAGGGDVSDVLLAGVDVPVGSGSGAADRSWHPESPNVAATQAATNLRRFIVLDRRVRRVHFRSDKCL